MHPPPMDDDIQPVPDDAFGHMPKGFGFQEGIEEIFQIKTRRNAHAERRYFGQRLTHIFQPRAQSASVKWSGAE